MLVYEKKFYIEYINFIVGIDEVGRGFLVGLVVVVVVIFLLNCKIKYFNDFKKILKKKY